MIESILTLAVVLPEAFEFLNIGWWVLHLVAIPLVFFIGMAVGKRKSVGGKVA